MKAIIIDDERLARQELKSLLSEYPEIEIIGESSNAEDAIKQIEEKEPDLIFLDIQMPGKNGFEMLQELDKVPKVIFVTAYDEYALNAFEVNALDYLLKPVQTKRLDSTLQKLLNSKGGRKENGLAEMEVVQDILSEHVRFS